MIEVIGVEPVSPDGDEDKARFCLKLGELIGRYTRNIEVEEIRYEQDEHNEYAVIHFVNGYRKRVCITADSCLGIMQDVYRALI